MPIQEGELIGGTHLYVRSVFEPSQYKLTETETRTLSAQIPALRAIDQLYFRQKGGKHNSAVWSALSLVAREGGNHSIEEYQKQMSIYGWLFDRSGNKIKPEFSEGEWVEATQKVKHGEQLESSFFPKELYEQFVHDEKAPKGAGVFVNLTDMTDKEFAEWAQKKLNNDLKNMSDVERSAKTHPFLDIATRVSVGRALPSYGEFEIRSEPWTAIYPRFTKEAAEAFWNAGEICAKEFPMYAALLKATGRGMLNNSSEARDMLLPQVDSRLYTFAGLGEEYIGSGLGWSFAKKAAYDFVLGVENSEMNELIEKTKSKLPEMVKALPEDLQDDKVSPVHMRAIDIVYIAGDTAHSGATLSARNWPNDLLLNPICPDLTFHVSDGKRRAKYLVGPAAKVLLPEDKILDEETLGRYSQMLVIIHENCHSLAKGKLHDTALEEGKATAGAIWHASRFVETKEVDSYCWAAIPNLVRTVRSGSDYNTGVVTEAHAIGENVILGKMFENGAAKVSDGKIEHLDPLWMRDIATTFFVDAARLQKAGYQGAIDDYLRPYRKMSDEMKSLSKSLDNINLPKSFHVDRGTIDELEARLRNYLNSFVH
jgi:hypothetical protein